MSSEVPPALSLNQYIVKEHLGFLKAANNFDLYDSSSGNLVLECREERLGPIAKLLRFTDYRSMTPFHFEIREPGGETLLQVKRGMAFFLSQVQVLDGSDRLLGTFQQRMFSLGGKFDVKGPDGATLCGLNGKWTGWEFSFGRDGVEFGNVSKKWAGLGKEMLTSADNYILNVDPSLDPDHPLRALIIAAVLCVDMVLKE